MSPLPLELIIKRILGTKKRKREEDVLESEKRAKLCDCEECEENRRIERAIFLSLEEQKRG